MEPKNLKDNDVKAVIFDMDGVITDSMWVWEKIGSDYLDDNDFDFKGEWFDEISGLGLYQAADYTIERLGLDVSSQDVVDDWVARALVEYNSKVELINGVKEYVCALKQAGMKLAVLTAAHHDIAHAVLNRFDMMQYFDEVISECQVNLGKETPKLFELVANILDVKPTECIMFEDSLYSAMSAKEAGMKVVRVCSGKKIEPRKEFDDIADYIISHYAG